MNPATSSVVPDGPTTWFRRHAWWLSFIPFGLWLAAWAVPWPTEPLWIRQFYRICGYLGAGALLIPYLHIGRNVFFGRQQSVRVFRWGERGVYLPLGGQTAWLRWHIGAAFASFVLVLVHCRGRANGFWTLLLLVLFWLVMLSGATGYWVRYLIYRSLAVTLRPEFGRARLRTKERKRLKRRAERLVKEYWKLTEYDVGHWQTFCRDLRERSVLPKSLWERAAREKGAEEAERVLDLVGKGYRFQSSEPNPLIGILAKLFKRSTCCKLDDFKQLAAVPNLDPVEVKRRERLLAAAELAADRERQLQTLEAVLGGVAAHPTAAQRDENQRLWREWDADRLKPHRAALEGVKKLLTPLLRWPDANALASALSACQQLENLPPDSAAQLARDEVEHSRQVGQEVRKFLDGCPPLAPDLQQRLKQAQELVGKLLKAKPDAVPTDGDIAQCQQLRAELEQVSNAETAAKALPFIENAARLRKVVERMLEDEVGRRNRLFLELSSREVLESQPPSAVVLELYEKYVVPRLDAESPSWAWLFTPAAREVVPNNYHQAVRTLISPREERLVATLVRWAERRRQLDVEDWLDRLSNRWLPWHAWSAVLLFVVALDHVVGSIRFSGY